MIDTDKYEGHSPAPWSYTIETEDKIWDEHGAVWDAEKICLALVNGTGEPGANLALMADAPLLLDFIVWVKNTHPHYYHKLTKAYQSAKNNR